MTEERVAKSEVAQPLRLERASELTAHGESLASHRDGRGAPPARRDDREYREYLSEEQRSRRGCIARRMQPDFRRGRNGGHPAAPRTDPYVQDCCIRLLPWMDGVKAHVRMRMQNPGARKPAPNETKKPSPGQGSTLAPAPKGAEPLSKHLAAEGIQTVHVARHRVVVEPALHHRAQPLPELHDRGMPAMAQLRLQRFELG